ncbi:MAG: CDGSH iron-sulfur domain-containing protein [Tatlockia sp.]|nr:CDGSH iron-sulfur domain-containing protein [Tatlockia sp.]
MTEADARPPFFPIAFDVEEGKTYSWCSCEKSNTQPLCDRGCQEAVLYQAIASETVYFCACKETKDPPLCDGSHARLIREYLKNKGTPQE